jgi:hypothetical protein
MRMRVSPGWPAALAVAGLLVGGCSGEDEEGKGAVNAGQVATVACPSQARSVRLPAGWAVPLPAGSVPVDVRNSTNGRVIVTSVVPTSESDTLKEMQRLFASAGLKLTEGETEKHDAESNFTGNGLTGRWGIRELTGCDGPATRIDMVVRKS